MKSEQTAILIRKPDWMQLHVGCKFQFSSMYFVKWPIVYCCVDKVFTYLNIPIFRELFSATCPGFTRFVSEFFFRVVSFIT